MQARKDPDQGDAPKIRSEVRQAATGNKVRYVLWSSIVLAIAAMVIALTWSV